MLAKAGPNADPMETLFVCSKMVILNENDCLVHESKIIFFRDLLESVVEIRFCLGCHLSCSIVQVRCTCCESKKFCYNTMHISLLVQKMQSPHSLACAISGKGTAKFDKLDLCFVYAIMKLRASPWQQSFHMWMKAIWQLKNICSLTPVFKTE